MSSFAEQWSLDPRVAYLNHGAFGASPIATQQFQRKIRQEVERQPALFFEQRYGELLDQSRRALARFVGADVEGLVPVANATTGVNTVLHGLQFKAGDELLVTSHGYNACRNALEALAKRQGATVVAVDLPFPVAEHEDLTGRILSRVTPRTRLAMLDHVTSPTALVLPLKQLVDELETREIPVLVDGAHGPGMLDLDVKALGASWYIGNAHKWLCAPRAAAFLWAREDRRDGLHPLVISHGANMPREGRVRLHDEFDWGGTVDTTPFFCIEQVIGYLDQLVDGGWPEIRRRNRQLVLDGRRLLTDALEIDAPAPESMIGMIASIPLPEVASEQRCAGDPLQRRLREHDGIEVPIMSPPVSQSRVLRISAQLYNDLSQYERLAAALRRELR
jgi:isopenicillin-N epimerase